MNTIGPIETPRVRLLPLDRRVLGLLVATPERLGDRLKLSPEPHWADPGLVAVAPSLLEAIHDDPGIGWRNRLIVLHDQSRLVGSCGAISPPAEDGSVELSYSVAPTVRGQGLATEACSALIESLWSDPLVTQILASCDPANRASERVLEKLGFDRIVFVRGQGLWRRPR